MPWRPLSYEDLAYDAKPIQYAHPERLAVLARLHGLGPSDPRRCRVLELGCADGAHLVPMAEAAPESTHVGVDLSPAHLERARALIASLGLSNVRFELGDVGALPSDLGTFDYVIAHGLYSWVPAETRERLLDAIERHLAPEGIAFLDFNVMPAGHLREALRGILAPLVSDREDGRATLAHLREVATAVHAALPADNRRAAALRGELERVLKASDSSLAHDWFEATSESAYYYDVAAKLDARGLRPFADAEPWELGLGRLTPAAQSALGKLGLDPALREHLYDTFAGTTYRGALIARTSAGAGTWTAEPVRALYAASLAEPLGEDLSPGAEVTFRVRGEGRLTSAVPLAKALLLELRGRWPGFVAASELGQAVAGRLLAARVVLAPERLAEELPKFLLELFRAGAIDLRTSAPSCAAEVSERPRTTPLTRAQARGGLRLANRHHTWVNISDPDVLALLALLDGTRDRAALLADWQAASSRTPAELAAQLEPFLARFAAFALLDG